jgi:hypothetical protein
VSNLCTTGDNGSTSNVKKLNVGGPLANPSLRCGAAMAAAKITTIKNKIIQPLFLWNNFIFIIGDE